MSATRPDPLAGWRAARAARAAGRTTVATVATAFPVVATPGEAGKSALVATVATVATGNDDERAARAQAEPEPMDHDAAERAAMAAHYAEEGAARPYQPGDPDPLRDGLLAGFRHHHRTGAA